MGYWFVQSVTLGVKNMFCFHHLTFRLCRAKKNLCLEYTSTKVALTNPKGHIYIRNIEFDYLPKITYRIGNALLTMERLLVEKKEQVLIRYTLEDTTEKTILRFKPFLAFRNIHT
jgi:hypothetical protein